MYALDRLTERGLSVTADGDRLIVSPADRLDDELRIFIREHKPEILKSVRDTVRGIPLPELQRLAGPDWPACESDPAMLEAFASAVTTRRMRERGEVPPIYTATTKCAQCGPVPIWEGCHDPMESCPWCLNRRAGRPVPTISAVG